MYDDTPTPIAMRGCHVRVDGIPAWAEFTGPEPEEGEWKLQDRGYRDAPWLEKKLDDPRVEGDVHQQIIKAMEDYNPY